MIRTTGGPPVLRPSGVGFHVTPPSLLRSKVPKSPATHPTSPAGVTTGACRSCILSGAGGRRQVTPPSAVEAKVPAEPATHTTDWLAACRVRGGGTC
eukprot:1188813-Prorocentrum_minimum.AAC.3